MLGVMQLFIWFKSHRKGNEYLALACSAFAVTGMALCEWQLMIAQDPNQFAKVHQLAHLPGFVMLIGIVAFVWFYFRTGMAWLAWGVVGLRCLVLALTFLLPGSINYSEIVTLKQITFLGQQVSVVAEAITNPLQCLAEGSELLLLWFVVDASVRLWRKGGDVGRRKALLVGGGIVLFLILAAFHTYLVHIQVARSPYIISLTFFCIILPMAHELSHDVLGAARMAESLRQAQERTALVVEAAPNAMIMVNGSAQIVLVNKQAELTFGYARDEMLGRPIEMLIPGRFSAGHPKLHAGYFKHPEKRSMGAGRELFGLRKDGTEVPVEVGLNPIETAEGRFVLASLIDISDRLRLEREAAERRAELVHLSRVSLLGQLSGSLAHELNQPLAIILSNAEAAEQMLADATIDVPELREIVKDIISEDLRAGGVIKSLRALLKHGEVRQQPISLNDVIRDVLRLVQSDVNARHVTVQKELAADLPQVLGDQVQLQQVVLNLIMNACDAMEQSPAEHRLLRLVTCASDKAVRLSVYDRGCGLPEGGAEAAFRSFYTTKKQGLGLGLSICRSIVAAHHGNIWCEAVDEGGTVFHVELQDGTLAEP